MGNLEAKQRIDALRKELEEHNRRYYVDNRPSISDYDFDLLMQELIQLENLYPEYISEDSPTRKVGSDLETASSFRQYPHKHPMLSLGNTYNVEELRDFDNRVRRLTSEPFTYNCELKFDGTGINLLYVNGILVRALTRGDGTVGDDVTKNIRTIKQIPLRLNEGSGYPNVFEIRGEIYMPFEAFDRLNAEKQLNEEQGFANPRNAAAGSLKMLNSADVAKRGLQCVLYHLIAEDFDIAEHSEALAAAKRWGLPISEYSKVCDNIDEVIDYINSWDSKRRELPFPTDGMVVKVNRFSIQKSLGYTSKTPRWAVAYKFKPEQELTKVLSVDYQVGRTGAVTPVANLEPVLLSGTIVKRATLHNADQMKLLDLHIGDYVYVEKGGEIIPKITKVELSKREPFAMEAVFPAKCPVCGTPLIRDEDEAKFFCPNTENCPPQIEGRFLHFCGRKAADINLGEATVHQMFERGYIRHLEDLYSLSDLQLLSLDKWKEKSLLNYRKSLQESRKVPFNKILFGLGIRSIGETTAKNIASRFKSIDALQKATKEELLEINDIGEGVADSIMDFFKVEANLNTIAKLKEAGLQFEAVGQATVSDELKGMTIMITGNYSIPRETMKQYIEAHGGKVGSSVTSTTTYLLAGAKAGEAKLAKANKLGIPIISEEEFYRIAYKGEGADHAGRSSTDIVIDSGNAVPITKTEQIKHDNNDEPTLF
ncbi:MAG: NAD-dependent DNA ligase LigA [Candidatus Egerieousia sp.]